MQAMYHEFCLATEKYEHPRRYGYDWFLNALDEVNESKSHQMDWLGLEAFCVDVLKSEYLTADQKITLLKDGLNTFTRRGHFQLGE